MNGGHEETNSEARSTKTLRDNSILSQTKEGLFTDSQRPQLLLLKASVSSDAGNTTKTIGRSYQNGGFCPK